VTAHDHGGWLHCPRCGARLPPARRPACTWCGWARHENPPLAVVAVVRRPDGHVLMVHRAPGAIAAGAWSLPGGFVDPGEDPEEALGRELEEEVGVRLVGATVASVDLNRDHRSKPVVVITYDAVVEGEPKASDDADRVGWFDTKELPPLAFEGDRARLVPLDRPSIGQAGHAPALGSVQPPAAPPTDN
jgi:8-oxo-dGTP diphosphatase